MTFNHPINSFGANNANFSLSDECLDLQQLIIGAHQTESKQHSTTKSQKNTKSQIVEIKVTDPQKFKTKIDEIEFFFENIIDKKIKFVFLPKNRSNIQRRFEDTNFDYVSLFSGGLDSSSYPLLSNNKQKCGLLSHTITSFRMQRVARDVYKKHIPKNNIKIETNLGLKSTVNIPLLHVRGVVFLTNMLSVAINYNIKKVIIPENGPFMINYPVSTLVAPTRTANYEMIEAWTKLVEDITGKKFAVRTPFFNSTKSDVVLKNNTPELIKTTWSCSTSQGISKMCGLCMACLVRILSLYAINQGEPMEDIYEFNILEPSKTILGSKKRDSFNIMINCLEFWKYLIHPDLAPTAIDQDICQMATQRYGVLTNHALDMYLGLKKYFEDFSGDSTFSSIAKQSLEEIDKKVIEKRSTVLDKKIKNYGSE